MVGNCDSLEGARKHGKWHDLHSSNWFNRWAESQTETDVHKGLTTYSLALGFSQQTIGTFLLQTSLDTSSYRHPLEILHSSDVCDDVSHSWATSRVSHLALSLILIVESVSNTCYTCADLRRSYTQRCIKNIQFSINSRLLLSTQTASEVEHSSLMRRTTLLDAELTRRCRFSSWSQDPPEQQSNSQLSAWKIPWTELMNCSRAQ